MDDICMYASAPVCVFGYEMGVVKYKGADIPTVHAYLQKKIKLVQAIPL